jgi:hypothetical protein
MPLCRIRLELARTPGFPEGSANHGYDLVAPLDAAGHLDVTGWQAAKSSCTVRRFWAGEDDERGHLVHTRHHVWAFSYRPGEDDDEPIFRLEKHVFQTGEYLSITEHDGVTRPFRVAAVTPLAASR